MELIRYKLKTSWGTSVSRQSEGGEGSEAKKAATKEQVERR